ncbi:hypothetical protein PHYPSEUDO_008201 [Phytophthora pseudosyringae]|uniref:Uncharacterized protein n=1 Tax=Phytophthora pseudosyringae TaxID=221518 RepID=A0A8T1WEC3_9STRA|nr:hypothetical protein PHYPSEUDO_008201 [Phytophthora pseudosyringae]
MADHHYHRHICSDGEPVAEMERPEDVLNIDECDVWGSKMPKLDLEMRGRRASAARTTCPTRSSRIHRLRGASRDHVPRQGRGPSRPYIKRRPFIVISSSGRKASPAHEGYVFPSLSRIFAMCGFGDAHRVAIEGLAMYDKEECFQNAVNEANCITDKVVQNHKLRLDMNCV